MKIDKVKQKKCVLRIKENASDSGYKKNQNTIFKVENDNIIFADFLIVNSEYLTYRINIKKNSFDMTFWKIMRMEDNIKKGDALKVNGAFSAPAILISKGKIELEEDVDAIANDFIRIVDKEVNNFFNENNVIDYIFSNEKIMDIEILKCLSYIDSNQIQKAIEVAKKQLMLGNIGRFENEGKGFFELLLLKYTNS